MTYLTKQIHLSTKETRITWLTSCFMNLIKYSFWCSCMALAWLLHGSFCTCLVFHTQSTLSAAPHVGIQPTGLWVTYWNLCKKPCKKKSPIVSASKWSFRTALWDLKTYSWTKAGLSSVSQFFNSSLLKFFFTMTLHYYSSLLKFFLCLFLHAGRLWLPAWGTRCTLARPGISHFFKAAPLYAHSSHPSAASH